MNVFVDLCVNFRHYKDASRRNMIETLLRRYDKINSDSAGAKRDSDEYRAYVSLPVPIRETLTILSGGEKFDSAEAWMLSLELCLFPVSP